MDKAHASLADVAELLEKRSAKYRFQWERAIRDDRTLKPLTRLVLLMLATHMDGTGTGAYPAIPTLAAQCGIKERATSAHIATAIERGWLVRTRIGKKVGSGKGSYGVTAEYAALIPNPHDGACSDRNGNTHGDAGSESESASDVSESASESIRIGTHAQPTITYQSEKELPHADLSARQEPDPFGEETDELTGADRARERLTAGRRARRSW